MPKRKIILHIGRHKTGTTGIQLFMSSQASNLAGANICYPVAGRDLSETQSPEDQAAHHGMARALMGPRDLARQYLNGLQASFFEETRNADIIVLSSEGFQNVEHFELLRDFFEGYEIEVICYLREYLAYVASAFTQEVKATGLVSDLSFFESYFGLYLRTFIDQWTHLADRCNWKLYDREHLAAGDVVADFVKTLDLPVFPGERQFLANSSFSGNLLGYKLIINTLGLHNFAYLEKMTELSRTTQRFTGNIYVGKSEQRRIRDNSDCNKILRSIFGNINEEDFENGNPVLEPETIQKDFDLISSNLSQFMELHAHPLINNIANGSTSISILLQHPALKMIAETHTPSLG